MKRRPPLDLPQQIDYLRRFGESRALPVAAVIAALVCVACLVLFGRVSQEPVKVLLLFFAGVGGLFAVALAVQLPQFRRGARATRVGRRVRATVDLVVDRSEPDSPVVRGAVSAESKTWALEFGKPFGWEPQEGAWPCELVFLADWHGPVLVQLAEGLLVPSRASRASRAGRSGK
ncbi:hypothetical protein [Pseudoxanthomonas sp. 10H]|uniref:hypothetical protein n=1 Tax=Pseudoxanthomonas sp. 10H TaxID=3242729 RepID=UPI003557EC2B